MQKLNLKQTLTDGVKFGIKNFPSLIGMIALYLITVWIPYLNVGTTIGLYHAIIDISKGKIVNPLSIFDKKHFEQMGDFFLLSGLVNMGKGIAFLFMIIPGIVIGIAWRYSIYILLEFKKNTTEAIHLSEKVTYGEKATIFGIQVLFWIAVGIVSGIFALIPKVGKVFAFIIMILAVAIFVAVEAVMYRHFAEKIEGELAPVAAPAEEEAPAAEE